ncbi:hypothetical protein G9A89_005517 [Geosiphon pyriformis]|nr:hypothetical protein G9A89_005517 [Geosiphon pyriformis]
MAMYADAKVRTLDIKLILDNGSTGSIITKQLMNQLSKINNFPFKINGIQIPTKVLVMKHVQVFTMCGYFKNQDIEPLLIKFKDIIPPLIIETYQLSPLPIWEEKRKGRAEEKPPPWGYSTSNQKNLFYQPPKLICINCGKKLSLMDKWDNTPCFACGEILFDERFWNDVPGREETCDKVCQYTILINNWYPHNEHEIWRMTSAKAKGATLSEIREIKENLFVPEYNGPDYITKDFFTDNSDTFQDHYQELAPI